MQVRRVALWALWVALAAASSVSAQEAPPTPDASPDELETPAPSDERGPRDHTYSIGPAIGGSRFRTENDAAMGMAGPSVVFDYTVGRRFGFGVRAGATFPMHGRIRVGGEGESVDLTRTYSKRLSLDVMFLFTYRMRPTPNLDIVFGGGIHVHTLRLVSVQYNPIELISGGFGGLVRIEERFAERFFFAGEIAAAIDPLDFVHHRNRAVFVAPISLVVFSLGVRR